jgi:hypothetical protein
MDWMDEARRLCRTARLSCDNSQRFAGLTPSQELTKLAAQMLMTLTPPSTDLADHQDVPKRVPIRWWRWLRGRLVAAEEQRRVWANRLKRLADQLDQLEEQRHQADQD